MKIIFLLAAVSILTSCKKYLDDRPTSSITSPSTIKDLRAILDNSGIMNGNYGATMEVSSDDYYVSTADWLTLYTTERNAYVWDRDLFNESSLNSWSAPYTIVFSSNVVLDAAEKIQAKNKVEMDQTKGEALFFRSYAFYNLLQMFAKPYDASTSATDPGIALRLDPDLNVPTVRATVKQSYEQVISDIKEAIDLLPIKQAVKTRPSKVAALSFLARVYQSMSDHVSAGRYADSALRNYDKLLNYSDLNPNEAFPFPLFNEEVIFHAINLSDLVLTYYAKVDTALYSSYNGDDLRKSLFFNKNPDGSFSFRGSYQGYVFLFYGIATDELYLIRAESKARTGHYSEALADLNTLLKNRYKTGKFTPYTEANTPDVLSLILNERRKELVFRGNRWTDLRRLNKEPGFQKTLVRKINTQVYTLPPNDSRYVFPIPEVVIRLTGIPQN